MFITYEDYKVVIGDTALRVLTQVSEENRINAEKEAIEEVASYLRPKYDTAAIFAPPVPVSASAPSPAASIPPSPAASPAAAPVSVSGGFPAASIPPSPAAAPAAAPVSVSGGFPAGNDPRNRLVVMYTCDIALYHMAASLPQKMGMEIRKERYERAIKWLEGVQAGKIIPDLPVPIDEDGNTVAAGSVIFHSNKKLKHEW